MSSAALRAKRRCRSSEHPRIRVVTAPCYESKATGYAIRASDTPHQHTHRHRPKTFAPRRNHRVQGAIIHHTLRRRDVEHRIDTDVWLCVLDLAAARGWVPLETQRDEQHDSVSYPRPAGMTISAEDAQNLAQSIEAELPTIHDEQLPLGDHAFGEDHTQALLSRRAEGIAVLDDDVRAAREILSGAPKQDAQGLAQWLRGGAFSIDAK